MLASSPSHTLAVTIQLATFALSMPSRYDTMPSLLDTKNLLRRQAAAGVEPLATCCPQSDTLDKCAFYEAVCYTCKQAHATNTTFNPSLTPSPRRELHRHLRTLRPGRLRSLSQQRRSREPRLCTKRPSPEPQRNPDTALPECTGRLQIQRHREPASALQRRTRLFRHGIILQCPAHARPRTSRHRQLPARIENDKLRGGHVSNQAGRPGAI